VGEGRVNQRREGASTNKQVTKEEKCIEDS